MSRNPPSSKSEPYPQRPNHFDRDFIRLLATSEIARTIGPAGCWFLTVIVQAEDRFRYTRPVAFWNSELRAKMGVADDHALGRIRDPLVKAGWLHHLKGTNHVAAQYWVNIPPEMSGLFKTPDIQIPTPTVHVENVSDENVNDRNDSHPTIHTDSHSTIHPDSLSYLPRTQSYPEETASQSCTEPAKTPASVPVVVRDPPVMSFPCIGKGQEWPLSSEKLAEWQSTYPGVDCLAEAKRARQWLLDNPTKKKTFQGMTKFLGNWFGRKQDDQRPATRPSGGYKTTAEKQTEYATATLLDAMGITDAREPKSNHESNRGRVITVDAVHHARTDCGVRREAIAGNPDS